MDSFKDYLTKHLFANIKLIFNLLGQNLVLDIISNVYVSSVSH